MTVPDLAVFDNVSEMKAVLAHAGLTGSFSAKGIPTKKEMEFKFAGQSHPPNTKVKRGTVISVSIYQKFDDTAAAMPGGKDTIPDVSGLSLDAAQATLAAAGLGIGGISEGGKAPVEEKANRIKGTTPDAGEKIPANKTVMLIKWGAFKDKPANPPLAQGKDPLGGTWTGKYAHWKGKGIRTDGSSAGDLQFSMRQRPDGGFYYFLHGLPLEDVQVQPGKVTGKDIEETSIVNGGRDGNLKRQYFTYSIEAKDGKLSIEMIQQSIFMSGATKTDTVVRGQMVPTTENMAGWASMMSDAEVQTMIDAAKKKRGEK